MRNRAIQVIVVVVALAVAGGAKAGDADCVWRSLSSAAKDALVARYEKAGVDALDGRLVSEVDKSRIVSGCVARGGNLGAVSDVIKLVILRDDFAARLRALNVGEAGVLVSWKQLTASERFAVAEMAERRSVDAVGRAAVAKIFGQEQVQYGIHLSGKPVETSDAILIYVMTLAMIERKEALF